MSQIICYSQLVNSYHKFPIYSLVLKHEQNKLSTLWTQCLTLTSVLKKKSPLHLETCIENVFI